MSNPIARNLRRTHPTLFRLSLALGAIYIGSGSNILLNGSNSAMQQPQQEALIHLLGAVPIGLFSIILGLLHFVGIFGKNYKATMLAYEVGMAYLSIWAVSYLFIVPVRPNLAITGFIGVFSFMYLTLGAIKERTDVHND